jgi:SAM-dependent methyltransferase
VVCGIPDFRVFADPYIGLEEDRAKARHLDELAETLGFDGLVRHYFSITPEVPPKLAASYTEGLLRLAPFRARMFLDPLDTVAGRRTSAMRGLEVGCASGPFLPLLTERFASVAATDIALRWLVVARQRLRESGRDAQLVCACAEQLPFRAESFDLLLASNLIEHVRDPRRVLDEALRTLAGGGILLLATPNRRSLGPDPHANVWGLGLLPRRAHSWLAQRLRGIRLEKIHTLSHAELRTLLAGSGFERTKFVLSELEAAPLRGPLRALAHVYNGLIRTTWGRAVLLRGGPFLQVLAYKR